MCYGESITAYPQQVILIIIICAVEGSDNFEIKLLENKHLFLGDL